jgi:hypothetical protein
VPEEIYNPSSPKGQANTADAVSCEAQSTTVELKPAKSFNSCENSPTFSEGIESFEKIIAVPLKDTFVADRLAELDQDSLIEKHRPLIDCAFAEVKQDIVKSLQHEALKDIKVDLVQALHNYEMDFKKIIVDILTFAWKEAKKFLKEVNLQNDMLNDKINSLLINYAEVAQDLPESWISSESATPPVDLVGGR